MSQSSHLGFQINRPCSAAQWVRECKKFELQFTVHRGNKNLSLSKFFFLTVNSDQPNGPLVFTKGTANNPCLWRKNKASFLQFLMIQWIVE